MRQLFIYHYSLFTTVFMFGFVLGLFFITLASALLVALIIGYHFWNYRLRGDRSVQILLVFLAGFGVLLAVLIVMFLQVPWNDIPTIIQNYQ